MSGLIEVADVVENEDGSATLSFDLDKDAVKVFAEIGLKFALYCAANNMTTNEVFETLQEIDWCDRKYQS